MLVPSSHEGEPASSWGPKWGFSFKMDRHEGIEGSGSGTFCMDEYLGEGTITGTVQNSPQFTISLSPDEFGIRRSI
jgi:hypothetical protein